MLNQIRKEYEKLGLLEIYKLIYNDALSRVILLENTELVVGESLKEIYTKIMLYKIKLKNITEEKDNSRDKNKKREIAEKLLEYYEAFNEKIELPNFQEKIAKHFKEIELQYAETKLNLK